MRKYFFALFLLIGCAMAAHAQTPALVEDINSGTAASMPCRLTVLGDTLYFGATTAGNGRELFKWYDMAAPSVRLSDLYPGGNDGVSASNASPMTPAGSKLYFAGVTASGAVLAYHDAAHPAAVAWTGLQSSRGISGITELGGRIYFVADSGNTPALYYYLYVYDGISPTHTVGRASLLTTTANWMPQMMAYNGKLYLVYTNPTTGNTGFGMYDPAANTTGPIPDTNPAGSPKDAVMFTAYGGKLYFAGSDSAHGQELYSYDGVATTRLTDIKPGPGDGIGFPLGLGAITAMNGNIYFCGTAANDHPALYKYNIAAQATSLAYDPTPASAIPLTGLYATASNVYFYGNSATTGSELYVFNGTSGHMLADLNPGGVSGAGYSNLALFGQPGYVYFAGDNGTAGYELYRVKDSAASISSTGIQAAAWKGDVTIYPNPATSAATLSITLQSPQAIRITLTDGQGREAWTSALRSLSAGKHEASISMQALAAGQYFYRVSDGSGSLLAAGAVLKE